MKTVTAIIVAVMAALCWLGLSAGGAAAEPTTESTMEPGTVYLISALGGAPANIVLNDQTVGSQTKPVTILGPFRLAPGTHRILIHRDDQPLVKASFTVAAGNQLDVVAHPSADATSRPTVTVFANTTPAAGRAILATTHIAARPPVNVYVNNSLVHRDLGGGQTGIATSIPGSITARAESAATRNPQLPPTKIRLAPGSFTRLFLAEVSGRLAAVPHVIAPAGSTAAGSVGGVGGGGAVAPPVAAGSGPAAPASAGAGAAAAPPPAAEGQSTLTAEASEAVTPYSLAGQSATKTVETAGTAAGQAADQLSPTRVSTGDGGQAAQAAGRGWWPVTVVAVALMAAAGAIVVARRRQTHRAALDTVPQHGR